jgi:replication factor A1
MAVMGHASETLGAPTSVVDAPGGAQGQAVGAPQAPPAQPPAYSAGPGPQAGGYGGGYGQSGAQGGGYGAPGGVAGQPGVPGGGHPPAGGGYGAPAAQQYGAPVQQAGGYGGGYGATAGQQGGVPTGAQAAAAAPQGGYQAQAPRYGNTGGAVARNTAASGTVSILDLNPYQPRWSILVRVTSKSDIRRWSNDRGEGRLASFDIQDGQGNQARVVAFTDALDKGMYDILQVGSCYIISKGTLSPAKKVRVRACVRGARSSCFCTCL